MLDPALRIYDEFLRTSGPDRLQKILARYELFRYTIELPGDVVECGVFKGSGVFTWVKLIQIFKPASLTRVIGFDFFEAERKARFRHPEDKEGFDWHAEGWANRDDLKAICAGWGFDRLELIAGDVAKTTKVWAETQLGSRISLLYIDVDNYEATRAILRNLYPLLVPGGIVAFDEYALPGFGEADAVDEYFSSSSIKLQSFPWARTPSAFMIKGRAKSSAQRAD